jgi:hypothetical protein
MKDFKERTFILDAPMTITELDALQAEFFMHRKTVHRVAIQHFCVLLLCLFGLHIINLKSTLMCWIIGSLLFLLFCNIFFAVYLEFRLNRFLKLLSPISDKDYLKLAQIRKYPEVLNYLNKVIQLKRELVYGEIDMLTRFVINQRKKIKPNNRND